MTREILTKTVAATACILVLWACTQAPDLEAVKTRLLEIDREFCEMSLAEGTEAAFLAYMAEEGTVYPYQGAPISGRENYQELIASVAASGAETVLQWEPQFADAAASGDLGYTLGTYRSVLTNADGDEQIRTGSYVTIWKKQADGTWKFVFDAGNRD
jgi:ketosteroid isomerase-like protein